MLVELISENGSTKKKYPFEGNRITLDRGSKGRGRAAYIATFSKDSVTPYFRGFWFLKWLSRKVYLISGADKCVEFQKTGETVQVNMPRCDQASIKRQFDANVIKNAGAVNTQLKVPLTLYIFMMMGFMLQFIVLMVVSGRLKL